MKHEILNYEADGLHMTGHYYVDEVIAGPRPGVLVFPEAFGLGEHAMSRAKRLAGLGYAALACDLHGDCKIISELSEVMQIHGELMADPSRTRARAGGALKVLTECKDVDAKRIAAIGYCFGGTMALELARSGANISGAVGFHSGLATARPQDAKNVAAKVMVCIGADDPSISAEQRIAFEQEMRGGGVDWQMKLYGGVVHSFTNPAADELNMPDFARYDAKADARSWQEMLSLFEEVFA